LHATLRLVSRHLGVTQYPLILPHLAAYGTQEMPSRSTSVFCMDHETSLHSISRKNSVSLLQNNGKQISYIIRRRATITCADRDICRPACWA